jgi:hypothetical protein
MNRRLASRSSPSPPVPASELAASSTPEGPGRTWTWRALSGTIVGIGAVGAALWIGHAAGLDRTGSWIGPGTIGGPLLGLLAFVSPAGMTLPCWASFHPRQGVGGRAVGWSSSVREWLRTRL